MAKVRTWSADCLQTRSLATLSQPLQSTGRVWVAVPDRFRWELGQPAQTIAIRQPDQLLLVYPRLRRAEKYSLTGSQPGPWREVLTLLESSFPNSRAEMESRFRLLTTSTTNSLVKLSFEPRSAASRRLMRQIRVTLRTNDFVLVATEMEFSDGSVLRNEFSNIEVNRDIPPERFEARLEDDFKWVEPLKR